MTNNGRESRTADEGHVTGHTIPNSQLPTPNSQLPLVSLIIVTYNSAALLPASFRNVRREIGFIA